MKIRIAGTEYSLRNKSFEIYVQGCDRACPGCHNPETQDHEGGEEVVMGDWLPVQYQKVDKFGNLVQRIFVSGGDLLCLPRPVACEFSREVRNTWKDKELWLFTGATKENVPLWVWGYYDVVKCGPYDQTKKQEGFPASSNQMLLLNKSRWNRFNNELGFKGVIEWI